MCGAQQPPGASGVSGSGGSSKVAKNYTNAKIAGRQQAARGNTSGLSATSATLSGPRANTNTGGSVLGTNRSAENPVLGLSNGGVFTESNSSQQVRDDAVFRARVMGSPIGFKENSRLETYKDDAGKTRTRTVTSSVIAIGHAAGAQRARATPDDEEPKIGKSTSAVLKKNLANVGTKFFAPLPQDKVTLGV